VSQILTLAAFLLRTPGEKRLTHNRHRATLGLLKGSMLYAFPTAMR
jgi:hypothetical protein